jgi:hypothetical protein
VIQEKIYYVDFLYGEIFLKRHVESWTPCVCKSALSIAPKLIKTSELPTLLNSKLNLFLDCDKKE